MEAGESVDSVGHPATQAADADDSKVQNEASQDPNPSTSIQADEDAAKNGSSSSEDAPDLTIMDGIPSLDAASFSSFLPAPAPGSTLEQFSHEGQSELTLEQQIQAFTADLTGQLNQVAQSSDPHSMAASTAQSNYNTPTQGQGTPATTEDIASFDTLLASLMPTPQPGSPVAVRNGEAQSGSLVPQLSAPQQEPASSASIAGSDAPASVLAAPPVEASPGQAPGSDENPQSFVDALLRQANIVPFSQNLGDSSIPSALAAATAASGPGTSAEGTGEAFEASLEQFMASLQARVSSSLTTEVDSDGGNVAREEKPEEKPKPKTPAEPQKPKKPRKVLGKRKYREIGPMERRSRVEKALSEYVASIDTQVKPNLVTGPIPAGEEAKSMMTTIRCVHASVARKGYGSEKRFFSPPPVVNVTGPLRRYAEHGAAILTTSSTADDADEEEQSRVSFLVKGEGDEYFSNEHVATLDEKLETTIRSLYVTPTGRSKTFRLQLNLLRPSGLEPHLPIFSPLKKSKLAEAHSPALSIGSPGPGGLPNGSDHNDSLSESLSRLPKGLAWASFESAPVTIISKSSKKTAKPRGQLNQVQNGSLVSLFNRINSQTARTKYLRTDKVGGLMVHSGEWSTYRITLISRPPLADIAGAEEGSITYGSTVVLTDINTGYSSDPLVVCKVDRGQVLLPQLDPPAELLKAGSGNQSRRVPIDSSLREKLAAMTANSRANGKSNGPAATPSLPRPSLPGSGAKGAVKAEIDSGSQSSQQKGPQGTDSPNANGNAVSSSEDLNLYGPVGQLQKVALMRFVPSNASESASGDIEHLESDFSTPRSFLCASLPGPWKHQSPTELVGHQPLVLDFAKTHRDGFGTGEPPSSIVDANKSQESNSITYVTPKTTTIAKEHSAGTKVVDEVDDAFVWTVIGISRFEYSYFDTSATQASKDEGPCEVPMTPFPLITSMPTYDQVKHTLVTTVTNFIVPAAITSDPIPLDVWIGSLGPMEVEHSARSQPSAAAGADPEAMITVRLPPIRDLLANARQSRAAMKSSKLPAHFLLPLIFVNDSDGTAYHSGRHVVCEDLVELMKATGHETSADVLKQLGFGLGDVAGPPSQGAWSLRII
ncbi:hypothetical protein BCV70DRAFT_199143 [Testicularia cyperi]|uniref:Uncharacterized protein n=1 Tax=Testicularia cyperi TaxID=1882483 RepID=A0A317XWK6_9BASI|nr:hypothetical protein BCV70DRAFT_199143 [Testicularia cyperi]